MFKVLSLLLACQVISFCAAQVDYARELGSDDQAMKEIIAMFNKPKSTPTPFPHNRIDWAKIDRQMEESKAAMAEFNKRNKERENMAKILANPIKPFDPNVLRVIVSKIRNFIN